MIGHSINKFMSSKTLSVPCANNALFLAHFRRIFLPPRQRIGYDDPPMYAAMGSSMCPLHIPSRRIYAFSSTRPSLRNILPHQRLMRFVPPLAGMRLGYPSQPHYASLRKYTNAQSACAPMSSITIKRSQTRTTASLYPRSSLISCLQSLDPAGPGTLLLHLGSGVRNVALQVALLSGCSAFGVELMEQPVDIVCKQRV